MERKGSGVAHETVCIFYHFHNIRLKISRGIHKHLKMKGKKSPQHEDFLAFVQIPVRSENCIFMLFVLIIIPETKPTQHNVGSYFFLWDGFCGEHCVCLYNTFFHLFSCSFITPTKKNQNENLPKNHQKLLIDNLAQIHISFNTIFHSTNDMHSSSTGAVLRLERCLLYYLT